jgi:hypothetical protein
VVDYKSFKKIVVFSSIPDKQPGLKSAVFISACLESDVMAVTAV